MTRLVSWRKYVEIDYTGEISDSDAALLEEGDTDVLAEYEDESIQIDHSVTEREVHP